MTNPDPMTAEAVERLKSLVIRDDELAVEEAVKPILAALSCANARAKAAGDGLLHPWAHGDKLLYDMGGAPIWVTYFGNDEGWAAVTVDADGPDSGPVSVRPSRLSARATLPTPPEGEG